MSGELAPRRRPSGLGRGLSALLGEVEAGTAGRDDATPSGVETVALSRLSPHPEQPRRHFDDAALSELAASIAARGIIQPIVVRRLDRGFQIIAGERRWRAAQRAQLHDVPIIVKDFSDAEALEVALVENIQREDLNAIEEAEAYRRLIHDFGHTQEALGRLVHKSRSHIANLLRLLDLPAAVREAVADGALGMGHARAIAAADDPAALAREVVAKGLSVRAAEALARRARRGDRRPVETKSMPGNADILSLERQLGEMLGLPVGIRDRDGAGEVVIGYATLDQLDLVCQRLTGGAI